MSNKITKNIQNNKEQKNLNNNDNITEIINKLNEDKEKENVKTPQSKYNDKNDANKKILDKKVKITKNNKIIIGEDGKPDFQNFPYVEDVVEFDNGKNTYAIDDTVEIDVTSEKLTLKKY